MFNMIDKVWIIPALMAASFLIILFFGKRWGTRVTAGIGIAAVSICLILSFRRRCRQLDQSRQ